MSKEENVLRYYVICNQLKDVIRKGYQVWNVKKERLESVAEHIFGVQMLAIAMKSEYGYDVNIMKVIYMLAIHDLGEIIIGDITQFEMSSEEKKQIEHQAVHSILGGLLDGQEIEELFLEFDERKTKEAVFAYQCDKLEGDLQTKLYGEDNLVDISNQQGNKVMENELVKKLLEEGNDWEEMWLKFGQIVYPYDDNFKAVSTYALEHKISKYKKKTLNNSGIYNKIIKIKTYELIVRKLFFYGAVSRQLMNHNALFLKTLYMKSY